MEGMSAGMSEIHGYDRLKTNERNYLLLPML